MFCLPGVHISKLRNYYLYRSQHLLHTAWSHQIKTEKTHSCPFPSIEMLRKKLLIFLRMSWGNCFPNWEPCLLLMPWNTIVHYLSQRNDLPLPAGTLICFRSCLKFFPSETGSPTLAVGFDSPASWFKKHVRCPLMEAHGTAVVTTGFVPVKGNSKPKSQSLCRGSIVWVFTVCHKAMF